MSVIFLIFYFFFDKIDYILRRVSKKPRKIGIFQSRRLFFIPSATNLKKLRKIGIFRSRRLVLNILRISSANPPQKKERNKILSYATYVVPFHFLCGNRYSDVLFLLSTIRFSVPSLPRTLPIVPLSTFFRVSTPFLNSPIVCQDSPSS